MVAAVVHRLVANRDATLMKQILDVAKGEREPHVEHHCQADHFRAGFEIAEGGAFGHPLRLGGRPAPINGLSSDSAHLDLS